LVQSQSVTETHTGGCRDDS